MATAPVGSCTHRPVSNGYGGYVFDGVPIHHPSAWCGRCKSSVLMDLEWIEKYAKARPEYMPPEHVAVYAAHYFNQETA